MSVTLTRHDAVALVTMDDGKANALGPELLQDLQAALDEALAGGARALVLAGRPGFFSGGLDLRRLPALSLDDQLACFHLFARVCLRLYLFPVPTIGAITGHAMAGGALFALATDVRFGADGAHRFALTEVPLGLPMPSFGIEIVRHSIPRAFEAELLLHGRTVTLAEARERGIFEDLYAVERVVEVALRRADLLARIPPDAYALTKDRIRAEGADRAAAALTGEVEHFITLFRQRIATR